MMITLTASSWSSFVNVCLWCLKGEHFHSGSSVIVSIHGIVSNQGINRSPQTCFTQTLQCFSHWSKEGTSCSLQSLQGRLLLLPKEGNKWREEEPSTMRLRSQRLQTLLQSSFEPHLGFNVSSWQLFTLTSRSTSNKPHSDYHSQHRYSVSSQSFNHDMN